MSRPVPAASAEDLAVVLAALGPLGEPEFALGPRTTYRVGGAARVGLVARSADDLVRLHEALAAVAAPVPVLVVGNGSNLLVADEGFGGVAVVLEGAFGDVHIDLDRALVVAGGAALLPVVARRTAAAGLRGFEWAVGVPGTVGGAVRMNAGGHGSDMAASLVRVRRFDLRSGEDGWVLANDLALGYRRSAVTADQVVVAAELALVPGSADEATAEVASIVRWRRDNQPGGANAGSVFTNPPGAAAGRLLDDAGAKGRRVGGVYVPDKHANFLQAEDGATAADVLGLMVELHDLVEATTGVQLTAETRLVGFPGTEGGPVGRPPVICGERSW